MRLQNFIIRSFSAPMVSTVGLQSAYVESYKIPLDPMTNFLF